MRLPRPSRNIAVPVITSSSTTRPTKKTSILRSFLPRGRRKLEEVFMGPKKQVKPIPEPCNTCGKEQNPERFHSHPLHMLKFKPKEEETKEKTKSQSKMIVTKPTALRYKSKSLEDDRKTHGKKNRVKKVQAAHKQSQSVDNSPKVPKKKEEKAKSVPIKTFIQSQKASINKKNPKDINIEIFEGEATSTATKKEIHPSPARERRRGTKENGEKTERENISNSKPVDSFPPRQMTKIEEESESRAGSSREKLGSATRLGTTARTLVCYICGREFGSRSITIHQPQCLNKWKRENERLPKHLQRSLPQEPEHNLTAEERNEHAYQSAQEQLVPCEWCGRTFFPERLVVHQRGCNLKPPPGISRNTTSSGSNKGRPDTSSNALNTSMNTKPTVVCYICGREFGSLSIKIHEPQCLRKWNAENDNLPPNLQRPEPKKPEVVYDDDGKVDKEATAEAAWQTHLETLVKCEKCDRTFFPDRLIVHQKACLKEA